MNKIATEEIKLFADEFLSSVGTSYVRPTSFLDF